MTENKEQILDTSKRFTNLMVWKEAHEFVLDVYKTTRAFPAEERFALSSQFQRAAVSIPANIAEGYKKMGRADKLRFMNISQGSIEECRYYIILSHDLSYINIEEYNHLTAKLEQTSRLLNSYVKGIINNSPKAKQ